MAKYGKTVFRNKDLRDLIFKTFRKFYEVHPDLDSENAPINSTSILDISGVELRTVMEYIPVHLRELYPSSSYQNGDFEVKSETIKKKWGMIKKGEKITGTTRIWDPICKFALGGKYEDHYRVRIEKETNEKPNCPYKGFEAFGVKDYSSFLGREEIIERLSKRIIEAVHTESFFLTESQAYPKFFCLTGASGTGKSSIALAGILGKIESGNWEEEDWTYFFLRPGGSPLESLAEKTGILMGLDEEGALQLKDDIRKDHRRLNFKLNYWLQQKENPKNLVIFIDQLEELFKSSSQEVKEAFLSSLLHIASDPKSNIFILTSLRSDYLHECQSFPGLSNAIGKASEIITALSAEEVTFSITEPADREGIIFESKLLSRITKDALGGPGSQALLQYTLRQLWDRMDANELSLQAYEKLGGVKGTLNLVAENTLFKLKNGAKQDHLLIEQACEDLFTALFQKLSDNKYLRNKRALSELLPESSVQAEILRKVINAFSDEKIWLLTLHGDQDTPPEKRYIEVSHEALIYGWDRLRNWIDQNAAFHHERQALLLVAQKWEEQGKSTSPGFILLGKPLRNAEDLLEQYRNRLTSLEKEFIRVSIHYRETKKESQIRTAKARRKRKRRMRRTLYSLVIGSLVIFAGILSLYLIQIREKSSQANALFALAGLESNPTYSLRTALSTYEISPSLPESQRALTQAWLSGPFYQKIDHTPDPVSKLSSIHHPESHHLLIQTQTGKGLILDLDINRITDRIEDGSDVIKTIAFSPEKEIFMTGGTSAKVQFWSTSSFKLLEKQGPSMENSITHLEWSPSGDYGIVLSSPGVLCIFPEANPMKLDTICHERSSLKTIRFNGDETKCMAIFKSGRSVIWDLAGKMLLPESNNFTLDIAHDGSAFLSSDDSFLYLRDFNQNDLFTPLEKEKVIPITQFFPGNQKVLVIQETGTVIVWEPGNDSAEIHRIEFSAKIHWAKVSDNGKYILIIKQNGEAEIRKGEDLSLLASLRGPEGKWIKGGGFLNNSRSVYTLNSIGEAYMWDLEKLPNRLTRLGVSKPIGSLCFNDAETLFWGSKGSSSVNFAPLLSPSESSILGQFSARPIELDIDKNTGEYLAITSSGKFETMNSDGSIEASQQIPFRAQISSMAIQHKLLLISDILDKKFPLLLNDSSLTHSLSMDYSREGGKVVYTLLADNAIYIKDTSSGSPRNCNLVGHVPNAIALSEKGNQLLIGTNEGILILRDIIRCENKSISRVSSERIDCVRFFPRSRKALIFTKSEEIRIWDLEEDQLLFKYNNSRSRILDVKISPDEKFLIIIYQNDLADRIPISAEFVMKSIKAKG